MDIFGMSWEELKIPYELKRLERRGPRKKEMFYKMPGRNGKDGGNRNRTRNKN